MWSCFHKENLGRITSDAKDRRKNQFHSLKCIHPLQIDSHVSYVLVDFYASEESDQSVNMNKAAELGAKQMIEFQDDLMSAFKKPLTTNVELIISTKDKQTKRKVNKDEYNIDLLLARALLLRYRTCSNLTISGIRGCKISQE